jgi:peptide/nickel transport system permease protein
MARRHVLGAIGAVAIVVVLAVALLAPVLVTRSPYKQAVASRLLGPGMSMPGHTFWLGSDHLGRDVLSRIIYGTRISLVISVTSVVGAAVIGTTAGLITGYIGRWPDRVLMRIVDLQLAIPFILLALLVVALWGPSIVNIITTFVITSWPLYARVIRSRVLVIREMQYLEAARALGQTSGRIVLRHVFPNTLNSATVLASYQMAQILIVEGALSFLGLGVQPPNPSWGNMLAEGRGYLETAWWLATFPGFAILLTATAINLLGDALRDWLDPQMRSMRY